jgi:uncharacterized membrane protein YfhO
VGDVDVAQSSDEALAAVAAPQFDPRRTAIVTASIPALTQLADGSVDITSYMPSNIQMTEHSTGSALLVTSQADYPGWQASIDGRAADLVNVNYAFLGVVVPDGAHSVELAYRPLSVYLGATITAITLILLIGAAVASRRADR